MNCGKRDVVSVVDTHGTKGQQLKQWEQDPPIETASFECKCGEKFSRSEYLACHEQGGIVYEGAKVGMRGRKIEPCHYYDTVSAYAHGNTERALAVAGKPAYPPPGGTVVVGQQFRVEEHVWQVCEKVIFEGATDGFVWRCRLVSKTAKSPHVLGENVNFFTHYLLAGKNVSAQSFEEDQRASSRRELELRDECGRLATQLHETRQTMAITADALSDVMAWLGPTKVRDFEKWRARTRK